MLRKSIFLYILCVCSSPLLAQRNIGVGVNAGTNGLGIQLGYKLSENFFIKSSYSNIALNIDDIDLSTDQVRQKANFSYLLQNGDLILDIHPFKNWFKICAGGSYNFQQRTLVGLSLQDTVYAGEDGDDPDDLGDFILYPDDLGFVNIDFLWNNINPYVGLGFGRAVPKKRVGFSVDFGVNYIGKITIEAEDSGMLVYDDYQSRSLEESLDTYRWLPRLQFALSVSL